MRFPQQPPEHPHRNLSDQQIRKSNRKVENVKIVLCLCATSFVFLPTASALSTFQLVGNNFGSGAPFRKCSGKLIDNCAYRVSSASNNLKQGFGAQIPSSPNSLKHLSFGNSCRHARHGLRSAAYSQMAAIIPSSALRPALLPVLFVVVMCILAAIPLGPSVSTQDPELVGEPGSQAYVRTSNLRKALGLQRRVFTSVTLGALVTAWIFSGTWLFSMVFAVAGYRALLEYYSMAEKANDCRPAKKCGAVALLTMYATACGTAYGLPFAYTDCVLPVTFILICGYLLTLKRTEKMTIADVQTTFMGIFYVGYLASFWIRLRALGVIPPSDLADLLGHHIEPLRDLCGRALPGWFAPDIFTQGAVVTWWTMISIAAADVGAYFTGKSFGRTKLSDWVGITVSPNKTKEGFLGGVALCSCFTTTGAWLMNWPLWWATGPLYGVMISLLGLLGDLTVSLFKRDAGIKDTGNLLPGHGGILDRIDSYMLTAAPVYYFIKLLSKFQGYPTPEWP